VDEKEDHTIEWIVPNAQKNEMEPILLSLPKGQKSEMILAHGGQEFGYVLQGEIQIVIGSKKYKAKRNETFYLSGKNSHYIKNTSSTTAKILWVSTPPVF
jgi:mannose-6-phosphate isomerase-like protein (cupin superfamily)